MTVVGPATEGGAPVVRDATQATPSTAAERLEYLVRLAAEALSFTHGHHPDSIRERMTQAAQAWTLEVDDLRAEVADRDRRIAQLEETVERLGRDIEYRMEAQISARDNFAEENRRQRQTIAALAAQLADEMRRGGDL